MLEVLVAAALAGEPLVADAEDTYLRALDAWHHGRVEAALTKATVAIEADPTHQPARLLAGYALLHLDRDEAGVAVLHALIDEPADNPVEIRVQDLASRRLHRATDPLHRDQVSLVFALAIGPERAWDVWHAGGGHAWQLGVPLGGHAQLRVDAQHPWVAGTQGVGGWRLAPMLVWAWAKDTGGVDVGVGPSVWLARGMWWSDGFQPYPGLRVAAGADARLGRRGGLRFEVGMHPHVVDRTLWWYGYPMDLRLGTTVWFGRPRGSKF